MSSTVVDHPSKLNGKGLGVVGNSRFKGNGIGGAVVGIRLNGNGAGGGGGGGVGSKLNGNPGVVPYGGY